MSDKKRKAKDEVPRGCRRTPQVAARRIEPIDPPEEGGTGDPDRLIRSLCGGGWRGRSREKWEP